MAKRRRTGDQLTGGTGDVSPQLLSGLVLQTAADTTTTATIALPVNRIPGSDKDVTIIELLKIWCDFPQLIGTAVGEVGYNLGVFFTTTSFGTTATTFNDPAVLALIQIQKRGAFTAAGTYFYRELGVESVDLTDGAGHGILVATDNMFAQCTSSSTGAANTVSFKLLYRFKRVSLVEYIGIVQSQQ